MMPKLLTSNLKRRSRRYNGRLVESLPDRVFRLRIARGYSVYELAETAGVLACSIQSLEAGKPVDKAVLTPLAAALDVPLCILVCGNHDCMASACVPVRQLKRPDLRSQTNITDLHARRRAV